MKIFDLTKCASNDDVAVDENRIEVFPYKITSENLVRRQEGFEVRGKIIVAVTGNFYPESVGRHSEVITDSKELQTQYEITELRTIFRGTKNIVDYWKKELEGDYDKQLVISHNIIGPKVKKVEVMTTQQLVVEMEKIIETICCISKCRENIQKNATIYNTKLRNIAVLGTSVSDIDILKSHLAKCHIKYQSIRESVKQPQEDAIVVDERLNALSYEWPVVIALDSANMISMSRAIVQLYIVVQNRDKLGQYVWDEWLKSANDNAVPLFNDIKRIISNLYAKSGLDSDENLLIKDGIIAFMKIYYAFGAVKKEYQQLVKGELMKTHERLYVSLHQIKTAVLVVSGETDEWALQYVAVDVHYLIYDSYEGKEALYQLLKEKCIDSNTDMTKITPEEVEELIRKVMKLSTGDYWTRYYLDVELDNFVASLHRGELASVLRSTSRIGKE